MLDAINILYMLNLIVWFIVLPVFYIVRIILWIMRRDGR